MKTTKSTAHIGGARTKAPGGLTRVLYVRIDQTLLDRLERLRSERSTKTGNQLSTADVVRWLLAKSTT